MPDDKPSFGSELKGVINHTLDEAGLSQTDYVKAALRWQYNWIGLAGAGGVAPGFSARSRQYNWVGLAGAAAFALVSGTGIPIVLAAGLELMYVALVPQSSRFRR